MWGWGWRVENRRGFPWQSLTLDPPRIRNFLKISLARRKWPGDIPEKGYRRQESSKKA